MRFDWTTLALQTVNVLVLIWLLRRFLFRPVADIIARRKDAADRMLAEAAAAQARAAQEADAAERARQSIAAGQAQAVSDARRAAEAERGAILAEANGEAAKARETAQAGLAQERRALRAELSAEAARLAVRIAARLLARVAAQAVDLALVQAMEARLTALTAEETAALAPPGAALTVVTAAPPDASAQAAWTEMLRRRLPAAPPPLFATDPALIAGAELRGPHGRLRNSWQADLDRIATELERDDERVVLA